MHQSWRVREIQRKQYLEIGITVLIHFVLHEIHIICNERLLFVVDTGSLIIKAKENYLKNHPKFVKAKAT